MPLDIRNIGCRRHYPDTWTLYASDSVKGGSVLKPSAKPLCRFHSRDVEDFGYEIVANGYVAVPQYKGVIESMDDLSMARPDMYVKDEDGVLYIIVQPLTVANADGATSVSRRPQKRYTMTLRRVEEDGRRSD